MEEKCQLDMSVIPAVGTHTHPTNPAGWSEPIITALGRLKTDRFKASLGDITRPCFGEGGGTECFRGRLLTLMLSRKKAGRHR
jgi:hypothetical protein